MKNLKNKIRLFIADDHRLFREGLRRLLEVEKDIKVVGEAEDGLEVLERFLKKKMKVDLLLLDINLPRRDGISVARELKNKLPELKILILSMYEDEAHILQAFNAGVDGYIVKTMPAEGVINSIRVAMRGEIIVPRNLTSKLVSGIRRISEDELKRRMFKLTPREIEILKFLGEGLSNKEIASILKVKEKTVKNQMNIIFEKLHVSNRTQAVLKAIKMGLISP